MKETTYQKVYRPLHKSTFKLYGLKGRIFDYVEENPDRKIYQISSACTNDYRNANRVEDILDELIGDGLIKKTETERKIEVDDDNVVTFVPKKSEPVVAMNTLGKDESLKQHPTLVGELELDVTLDGPETNWFRDELRKRVIGQEAAVESMVAWFRRWRASLNDPNRPISSMLLLGPTGTGKTRVVEAAAEILHGDANLMMKIDCGEFQHDHEIAKLAGSPPGYLGHNETKPRLAQDNIDRMCGTKFPVTFILFDEIEKACEAAYRILLGILDKATFTDGSNHVTKMNNCVIVMTSNLGARTITEHAAKGKPFEAEAISAARSHFSPEFWNRLDSVTVYKPLDKEAVKMIANLEIKKIGDRITQFKLTCSEEVVNRLATLGFSPENGARFLRRTIERELLDPITRVIATKQVEGAHKLDVRLENDRLRFFAVGAQKV